MNFAGWLFLALSWGLILGLTAFCFWRIFTKPSHTAARKKSKT